MNLIKMEVSGIYIDPQTNMPIIILKNEKTNDILPIWIGPLEATSILMKLEKIEAPRPMTHDLLVKIFEQNKIKIKQIMITSIKDNTYYAKIIYKSGFRLKNLDARPSDAISLALRTNIPIFVSSQVMEQTFNMVNSEKRSENYYRELLEKMDKKDLGDSIM